MKKYILLIFSMIIGAFIIWLLIPLYIPQESQLVFYDNKGEILFSEKPFFQNNNKSIETKPTLKDVLVAVEDERFFSHIGIDTFAVGREIAYSVMEEGRKSGASTLTMQLARMLYLTDVKRDWKYKIKQSLFALKIEMHLSKEEILDLYMDKVYLGHQIEGFSSGANAFFGKSKESLTIGEKALLIGLLPRPEEWNPHKDEIKAEKRKNFVLSILLEKDLISEEEREYWLNQKTVIQPRPKIEIIAPHFVLWAKDNLKNFIGKQGLVKVYTTLDKQTYQKTLEIVRNTIKDKKETKNISNASVVILDMKEELVLETFVGSKDFFDIDIDGEVNMATSKRELGSTLKPFVFALALEKGFSPLSEVKDERRAFSEEKGLYSPRNFNPEKEYGMVRFREALTNSYNISAVDILEKVGKNSFVGLLKELNIISVLDFNEIGHSVVLGTGESSLLRLTNAYEVFPNKGILSPVKFFDKIVDYNEKTILTWDKYKKVNRKKEKRILKTENAEWVTHALSDQSARWKEFSRVNPLQLEFETASKTGTSQNFRDNFVVGYSTEKIVGTWVGNADGTPLYTSSGVEGAGPIWQSVMRSIHNENPRTFKYTSIRKEKQVCRRPYESITNCSEKFTEFLLPEEMQYEISSKPKFGISFPNEGEVFHRDSSLLIKTRSGKNKQTKFFLDGKSVQKIIPQLLQGSHIIQAINGRDEDKVSFFVE